MTLHYDYNFKGWKLLVPFYYLENDDTLILANIIEDQAIREIKLYIEQESPIKHVGPWLKIMLKVVSTCG